MYQPSDSKKRSWALARWLPALLLSFLLAMPGAGAADFVSAGGGRLWRAGRPLYALGADLWYAPSLACDATGGGRQRLCRELDRLDSLGVACVAFGAVAFDDSLAGLSVQRLTEGLDFLLSELSRRGQMAAISLPQFSGDQEAWAAFADSLLTHRNPLTGRRYADEPAVMAWIVRPDSAAGREAEPLRLAENCLRRVQCLKRLDANHMVWAGGAGMKAFSGNEAAFELLISSPAVDAVAMELHPVAWNWVAPGRTTADLPFAFLRSGEYIALHDRLAFKTSKPVVITSFSYPRHNFFRQPGSRVDARDSYYDFIASELAKARAGQGALAAAFFCGWGGEAVPDDTLHHGVSGWLAERPGQQEGLFSVYLSDRTTLDVIRRACRSLQ